MLKREIGDWKVMWEFEVPELKGFSESTGQTPCEESEARAMGWLIQSVQS